MTGGPVDRRSGRVVFVSHCLLNENVRYPGGATRRGAVREVVDRYVDDGVGVCQMPCPEQRAWGGVRKPYLLRLFGVRLLRRRLVRAPLVAVATAWTRAVHRRVARQVASDIAGYVAAGLEVTAIVGVGGSPSCGVTTTVDVDGAVAAMATCDLSCVDAPRLNREVVVANVVPGSGTFVACLDRELRRRGLEVPFVEHDLVAELTAAGAVAPPKA